MASIPLPALAVQPPPNPLDQVGKILQMKSLLQDQQFKQQIQPIELQSAQQDAQIRAQQLKDQQAMTAAWAQYDPDKNKPDDMPSLILKNGGSGAAAQQAQQHILQMKDTASQIAQRDADAGEKNIDTLLKKRDQALGILDAAKSVPDEQLTAHLSSALDSAEQQQLLDPQHIQAGRQLAQSNLPPDQMRQQLQIFENSLKGQSQLLKDAQEQATTEHTQLENDALKQMGGMTPQLMESKYIHLQALANQGTQLQAADKAFMRAYEKNKTLVPQFNLNMQGANQQFSPSDPTVAAVAAGSMKIGDVITPRTPLPARLRFLAAVKESNPNFNSANFDIEKGVMKDFTSGDAAKNLTAFNTAIEHAQQLQTATDALDNGDSRALNKIGNTLGYQFGSDKTTNFNVIKNALSGEISKVFKGGQATDAEIREVQQPFDSANSTAQLKGAIKNAIALMNSKRDALKAQYNTGIKAQPNFGGGAAAGSDPFSQFGGKTR